MTDIIGIGLQHFATRAAALKFERAALRGLAEEAREKKRKLWNELGIMHDSLTILLEAGVAKDVIAEALAGLIDGISNADHRCNQTLDEAGTDWREREPIDLTEARAMLDGLRRPHSKVVIA